MARGFQQFEEENDQYKQIMQEFKNESGFDTEINKQNNLPQNKNDPFLLQKNSDQYSRDEKPIRPGEKNFEKISLDNIENTKPQRKNNGKPPVKRTFLKRSQKSSLPQKTK